MLWGGEHDASREEEVTAPCMLSVCMMLGRWCSVIMVAGVHVHQQGGAHMRLYEGVGVGVCGGVCRDGAQVLSHDCLSMDHLAGRVLCLVTVCMFGFWWLWLRGYSTACCVLTAGCV